MYFPEKFISTLIMAALACIAIGALTLIILMIDDVRKNKLW